MISAKDEIEVATDIAVRKRIIQQINSPENIKRKQEAYRRHLCLKDQTKQFAVKQLESQFDPVTVQEMEYSIANISFAKKIINKLARVYAAGVKREGASETDTKQIEEFAKYIKMDSGMKKTNRFMRAHFNAIAGLIPFEKLENNLPKWGLKLQVHEPYLYDAVSEGYDSEVAMFYILSDFDPTDQGLQYSKLDASKEGRTIGTANQSPGVPVDDERLAKKEYVWWSNSYHFTTNGKGEIITQGEGKNPIVMNPFVNFPMDQEGCFWASGGGDVFDGAIRLNCMITNLDHIGVVQGYGQFWMKGKNLPQVVKVGPNKVVKMEQENKDDPEPSIGYASASPQLTALREQIVMYVALLLTTNNLSTRAVSSQLNSSSDVSGIALVIDKSESIEDVEDQQTIFKDNEPVLFKIGQKWLAYLGSKNLLIDEMKALKLPENPQVKLEFNDMKVIMSEKEKLEALKLRKELGIDTMVDLIMKDNPGMSKQDAEKKLMEILAEKVKNAALFTDPNANPEDPENPNAEEDEEDEGDENDRVGQPDDKQD